ncbi:MAG: pilus assembly protein TadG-related protein [Chloroflexota bacterium]
MKESIAMLRARKPGRRPTLPSERHESERGQLLALFALAMIAMIAMVGLIIDGGDTALQRRDQQNVADAAAMAAGYAYVNDMDETAAAQSVAASNGYVHGTDNTTVTVTVGVTSITVAVTRPHRNYFSGIVGFSSWDVTAEATVQAGVPNGAYGAMPLIFNDDAFNDPANQDPYNPVSFSEPGTGTEDVPQGTDQFNWTVFCTASGNECNGNSDTVDDLINDEGTSTVIYLDDEIGPLNAGSHTTLFSSLAAVVGHAYPVAIVDDSGALMGWAWFHITGSMGGETKQISGYFDTEFNAPPMTIVQGRGDGNEAFPPIVQLID